VRNDFMQRFRSLSRFLAGGLAIAGALIGTTFSAVPVGAQTLPHVSVPSPIVAGVIVPHPPIVVVLPGSGSTSIHRGGLWQETGRADVDLEVNRSRDRGHALVR
jgi:hypothetical protein